MHWFWRAAMALFSGFLAFVIFEIIGHSASLWRIRANWGIIGIVVFEFIFVGLPSQLVALGVYASLSSKRRDDKTRCRKCG
jgi:hypothetical protein